MYYYYLKKITSCYLCSNVIRNICFVSNTRNTRVLDVTRICFIDGVIRSYFIFQNICRISAKRCCSCCCHQRTSITSHSVTLCAYVLVCSMSTITRPEFKAAISSIMLLICNFAVKLFNCTSKNT